MAKYLDLNGLLYFWNKIKTSLDSKVDVVSGKGLSTEDYTSAEKTKLSGIETGAQVNTVTGVKGSSESNYKTGNVSISAANIGLGNVTNNKQVKGLSTGTTEDHVMVWGADGYTPKDSGFTLGASVPANAEFTDTTYDNATQSASGLMSSTDKTKLDGIDTGANKTTVDSALSASSTNPVRNSVIKAALDLKLDTATADTTYAKKTDISGMYKYKGSVASYSALPASADVGDVYNTEDYGKNYAWDGTAWDDLGGVFAIETISNSEIDTIVATVS